MEAFAFEFLRNFEQTGTVEVAHSGAIMYKNVIGILCLPRRTLTLTR